MFTENEPIATLRTENYPREAYLAHPLRDPAHAYGGARRFDLLPGAIRQYFLPRNPGRWRPGNPDRFPSINLPLTRQQLRAQRRKAA